MRKEDIKNEKMHMHPNTTPEDNGGGWVETLADQEGWLEKWVDADHEEVEEDLPLAEVVKDASGQWVEA